MCSSTYHHLLYILRYLTPYLTTPVITIPLSTCTPYLRPPVPTIPQSILTVHHTLIHLSPLFLHPPYLNYLNLIHTNPVHHSPRHVAASLMIQERTAVPPLGIIHRPIKSHYLHNISLFPDSWLAGPSIRDSADGLRRRSSLAFLIVYLWWGPVKRASQESFSSLPLSCLAFL